MTPNEEHMQNLKSVDFLVWTLQDFKVPMLLSPAGGLLEHQLAETMGKHRRMENNLVVEYQVQSHCPYVTRI